MSNFFCNYFVGGQLVAFSSLNFAHEKRNFGEFTGRFRHQSHDNLIGKHVRVICLIGKHVRVQAARI